MGWGNTPTLAKEEKSSTPLSPSGWVEASDILLEASSVASPDGEQDTAAWLQCQRTRPGDIFPGATAEALISSSSALSGFHLPRKHPLFWAGVLLPSFSMGMAPRHAIPSCNTKGSGLIFLYSYWKHILCHWKRLGSCGGEEIHSWLRDPLLLPCIYQAPWAQGFLKALDFLRKERQPNLSVVSPFQGRHPCLMVTNDTHSGKWCQLFTAQPARWNRLVHQGGTAGFGLSVHGDVLGAIQNLPSCPWHPENNICH